MTTKRTVKKEGTRRKTKRNMESPDKALRRELSPFSVKLNELRRQGKWSVQELADYLGRSYQQTSRLLNMKGNEQLPLNLIKRIFDLFAPENWNLPHADQKTQKYIEMVDPNEAFRELVYTLTRQKLPNVEQREPSPADLVKRLGSEELYQRFLQDPTERWIVTDLIGEIYYHELMKATCRGLKDNLRKLVFFMPRNALGEFDRFEDLARHYIEDDQLFASRVMCIGMPEWVFWARMRIDYREPDHQLESAVFSLGGITSHPVFVRMDERTVELVFRRFNTIVREFDERICDKKLDREHTVGEMVFYLKFP